MKALIGISGIAGVQAVSAVPASTPTVELVKVAIQLILGIASLWHMFKTKKENTKN